LSFLQVYYRYNLKDIFNKYINFNYKKNLGGEMKSIKATEKKKITLDEISKFYGISEYPKLVMCIKELINSEDIKPIKSSKTNGKKPALYNAYTVIVDRPDYSKYNDELKFNIHSCLKIDYYLKFTEKYIEDRGYVLDLSNYLEKNKDLLSIAISINERSFEIWKEEKFLQKHGGIRILKNLGLTVENLNVYETTEPLVYYSHHKNTPQNVIIIENKDTFYSMRRHLLKGYSSILGLSIGSIIYGAGKGIQRSFKDFTFCVEPYLSNERNNVLYFGDLDFEGILIYESLQREFKDKLSIKPFVSAYRCMLNKADICSLPYTKEGQNKNIGSHFLESFNKDERDKIIHILDAGKYIPQEILNCRDF